MQATSQADRGMPGRLPASPREARLPGLAATAQPEATLLQGSASTPRRPREDTIMLRGALLWLLGIPLPIILLLWLLGVFR